MSARNDDGVGAWKLAGTMFQRRLKPVSRFLVRDFRPALQRRRVRRCWFEVKSSITDPRKGRASATPSAILHSLVG